MTTANKLTILRMVMIPLFILVMYLSFPGSWLVALLLFIAASVTDFADGYIARKYDQITDFGKFMDPLADKLLVAAALILFTGRGQCPAWACWLIIAREFAVTALRLIAVGNGLVIAAAWSGKIKTACSILAICVMLTPLHGLAIVGGFTVDTLCVALMVILTVWSGAEYFAKNRAILSGSGSKD